MKRRKKMIQLAKAWQQIKKTNELIS